MAVILGAFLLGNPFSLIADTVGMRTQLAIGQTMNIAVNNGVKAVLDWGNGNTSEMTFTGLLQEIPVQGDSLQIKTSSPIISFCCSDNQIVTLNLSQARSLEALDCNDNALKRLDLYQNRNLISLNCQRNTIEYLRVKYCTRLQILNCAQNPLKELDLGKNLVKLSTLICAENQLSALDVSSFPKLEQLWCNDNLLESLSLSKNTELKSLYAFGNRLSNLEIDNLSNLTALYVNDNDLSTMELSNLLQLKTISIDHNHLGKVGLSIKMKNNLKHFYANDNLLAYNSFPTVYSTAGGGKDILEKYNVAPQNAVSVVPAISVGEQLNLSALINKNGWGTTVVHTVTWKYAEGNTDLEEGIDFNVSKKGVYTFLRPLGDVYAEITAPTYPGLTLCTTPVKVMADATAIQNAAESTFRITSQPGMLVVSTDIPVQLNVIALDGRTILSQALSAGTHYRSLPAGIYIVNGRRVLIGR